MKWSKKIGKWFTGTGGAEKVDDRVGSAVVNYNDGVSKFNNRQYADASAAFERVYRSAGSDRNLRLIATYARALARRHLGEQFTADLFPQEFQADPSEATQAFLTHNIASQFRKDGHEVSTRLSESDKHIDIAVRGGKYHLRVIKMFGRVTGKACRVNPETGDEISLSETSGSWSQEDKYVDNMFGVGLAAKLPLHPIARS